MREPPVALIPAAGRARRLGEPAGSKEVLGVGPSERPVIRYLLDGLARAGAEVAYVVTRAEKQDLVRCLGDGEEAGLPLAYVVVPETRSICETLDRARPFVRGRSVVLGFPDILFRPEDAFARIVARYRGSDAHAVLAAVPTDRPQKADLVRTDREGRVTAIEIKPRRTDLRFTWIGAVWGPEVTELQHELVREGRTGAGGRELYPSDVLLDALDRGLQVEALHLPEGRHLDVGTPEDLERAAGWPGRG
ncbi:MAG: NDP-sugar synthase [Thermoanaerobaculia bacterium]